MTYGAAVVLDDVVDVVSGFAFKSEGFGTEGDLPVARIRDVVRGYSNTYYSGPYDEQFVIDDGDILIGMDGEFNRAYWRGGRAVLNQRVCRVEPRVDAIDRRYLYYFLPSALKRIENETPYVTVKHLSAKQIRAIRLHLPPIEEQRRIADMLDRADVLRAKRQAVMEKLESLKQSIFLQMFGDPFSSKSMTVPLKEVADVIMGQSPPGASYNTVGNGLPLLNGPVEFGPRFPTERQWTTKRTRVCQANDILFCVRASAGKLNVADKPYCLGRGLAAIRPREGSSATGEFLLLVLDRYYEYFQRRGVGSTFINISRSQLETVPIPKPTPESAKILSSLVHRIDVTQASNVQSSALIDALSRSLEHKAFAGRL